MPTSLLATVQLEPLAWPDEMWPLSRRVALVNKVFANQGRRHRPQLKKLTRRAIMPIGIDVPKRVFEDHVYELVDRVLAGEAVGDLTDSEVLMDLYRRGQREKLTVEEASLLRRLYQKFEGDTLDMVLDDVPVEVTTKLLEQIRHVA